ncbi:MAG TPA: ATP-binding protein, partial [Vicinamibacteria bacterium]|nr:ATP-binding protein [Vicinamibacteria bacterium]
VLGAEYQTGEVVGRRILVEIPSGVSVSRQPPADPFALPSEPITRLIAYRPGGMPVHRVRTTGVVTGAFFPDRLFLSDGEKGLVCQTAEPLDARVGEAVDVVGFLPADGNQRRLADVLVRRRGTGVPVTALPVHAEDLRGGEYAAMLVRVNAALRRRYRELGREHLFMEDGRQVFEAVLELPRPEASIDSLREGSLLGLTGVCSVYGDAGAGPAQHQPCRLMLRSPADLELLRPASWWTRDHALGLLGLVSAFAAFVVAWVFTLERRVSRQTAVIRRQVLEEAELQDRLRQAEKMESIGRLAGGVAHDFNNLLTGILGYCDILLRSAGLPDRAQRRLGEIKKAAERAADLTRQLLAFSRKQVLEPRVLDLNHVVTDLAPFLRRMVGENVDIQTVLSTDAGHVEADPGQIQQVLLNLASNARDAMPDGGRLLIETGNVDLDGSQARQPTEAQPGPYVLLSVADTGLGMSPEVRARVFEPFFTTKTQGRGTGLGLATVEGIVRQSRGYVGVDSELGHGSTFRVYLPRVDAPESPREAAVSAAGRSAGELILLVEDEDIVAQVASAALSETGYRVLSARSGEDAIRVAATCTEAIRLLLTDVVLTGPVNGRQLADRLTRSRPGLRTVFMSGYTENVVVQQGVLEPGVEFLSKPFTTDALCRKVREVLDR